MSPGAAVVARWSSAPQLLESDLVRIAFLFLVTFAVSGHAYELRQDALGNSMRWKQAVKFVIDEGLAEAVGDAKAIKAVRAALKTFADVVPELELDASEGKRVPPGHWLGKRKGQENANSIIAESDWSFGDGMVAVTVYSYNVALAQYVDTDIVLNTANWAFATDGRDDAFDIQNVVTHEIGHALGLQHNLQDLGAVMYPSTVQGETNKRKLASDDLEGLAALYETAVTETQGCAAAPSRTALPVALLALIVLARRGRRAGRSSATAAAGVTALLAFPALASEPQAPARVRTAGVVATVQVVSSRTLPPKPTDALLRTEVTVAVRECLSGSCPQELILTYPGGRHGDLVQFVEALRVPSAGAVLGIALDQQAAVRNPAPRQTRIFKLDELRGFVAFGELLEKLGRSPSRRLSLPR